VLGLADFAHMLITSTLNEGGCDKNVYLSFSLRKRKPKLYNFKSMHYFPDTI
jgi:hypothetical protein